QAEDGIRARNVTGVQTCALPILMKSLHAKSRDNARTPMQWDDTPNAGFTTGTPWLMVNPNYKEINAARAVADPDSVFHYYQKLRSEERRAGNACRATHT